MKVKTIHKLSIQGIALICSMALFGCGAKNPDSEQEIVITDETSSSISPYIAPTGTEDAEIYVEAIDGISDDFIRGMDASSVLVEENSGVVYYNDKGEVQDVFQTLAEAGTNYIRIRVWNDPFDSDHNGYGGGNNDLDTAITLGKRATAQGMKVFIDFHYSDFWADPAKQMCPKAWEGMSTTQKADALYTYTKDSLQKLLDAGVDVGMVQIGNEINNGMSGESSIPNVTTLLSAGSKAIREISSENDKEILIAVHYTNIENADNISKFAYNLQSFQVDYDVFGVSFYPYWHGSIDNMKQVLTTIQEKYHKKTMIAETAFPYTIQDGDGAGNSYSELYPLSGYSATVQSQATMLRDICAAANEVGAIGVFYWEGTWIPVPADGSRDKIWETYGSGWASKFASEYDPNDAGQYYGGCSWENQALFNFDGYPLASLSTYRYLKYGTNCPLTIDFIPDTEVTLNVNSEIILPDSVPVIYNDRSKNTSVPVIWSEEEIAKIDTGIAGDHIVSGTLEDGTPVTCNLHIIYLNYVQNGSFEDTDTSMWSVTFEGDKNPTDFQKKSTDAHSGDYAFHFWSEKAQDFEITQQFTNLEPGVYELSAFFQGGDIDSDAQMELFITVGDYVITKSFEAKGYAVWQNPTISEIEINNETVTIGVHISCNAKGWGTIDDFTLNKR